MFKFIHAADIHLDSPLLNLDQYDGAPADSLRVATREAFDNLVQLAIDERVQFLLIAGDLYDKDSPDFNTPRHVRRKFGELADHNIDVFVIQGNHDATSVAKKAFQTLTMPDNVRVLSTRKPETIVIEELDVAVHGQGFASKAVEHDLSARYPAAVSGLFNIGLLHTNLGGKSAHDNYAPSTVEGLRAKDYQYWALGHIHKRDQGIGGTRQVIHYSGNTQGRHINESGPKGCTLVSVDAANNISMKFRPTDVWRWVRCDVDAREIETAEEAIDAIVRAIDLERKSADERALAVRATLKGSTAADRELRNYLDTWKVELQRSALDAFDDQVWIEKLEINTTPPSTHTNEERSEAFGELVSAIQATAADNDLITEVRDELEKVLKLIPTDTRLDHLQINLDDDETTARLIEEAKQYLVAKLTADDPSNKQGAA